MCRYLSPLGLILCACVVSALFTTCATSSPISPELARCMTRPDSYVSSDNGTVFDTCTQLTWLSQDYRNLEGKAPPSYEEALKWVDAMQGRAYAGYRDWRIPTRAEYQTLYDPSNPQRSYNNQPVGYATVFAAGGGKWYWTSEVAEWGSPADHIHDAWIFDFTTGKIRARHTHPSHHVWAAFHIEETGSVRLVRMATEP